MNDNIINNQTKKKGREKRGRKNNSQNGDI